MKDTRIRSVAKGLTWRLIATLTTMGLVYWATGGSVEMVVNAGILDVFIKLLFYYGHERAWGRVAWGRAMVPIQTK